MSVILQLKVGLRYMSPPVRRRLQLDEECTFYGLHEFLQIAFGWTNSHLHGFEIHKSKSKKTQPPVSIGDNEHNLFNLGGAELGEQIEVIGDWLVSEKDKCVYTYDFGANWEHEIVLEKILTPEKGVSYPRCIKVAGVATAEDGWEDDSEPAENTDTAMLLEEINLAFAEIGGLVEPDCSGWPGLFAFADEFKKLQPWKWLDDDQIFVVQDPKSGELVYCSIMGAAGQEFGLVAFIGSDGYRYLRKLMSKDRIDEHTYLEQSSIILSFNNRDELSPEDYQLLKENGLSYRGKKQWPQFRSFLPGYYPWPLDEDEVRLFSVILEQVIEVCQRARMDSGFLNTDSVRGEFFAKMYNHESGEWGNHYLKATLTRDDDNVPLFVGETDLFKLRKSAKKLNMSLEFDVAFSPMPVQDQPNQRPYFPLMGLGLERKNGLIVFHEMAEINDLGQIAQQFLINLIENLKGIPREIWVTEELYPILIPIGAKLKINLMAVKHLKQLESARKEMYAYYSRR